jgi:pimeloyl-ACP methyl ester carboxylesterase
MRNSTLLRVLRGAGILICILVALLYIGLPVGMGIVTILPAKARVGSLPAGYEEVTLRAEDGVQLKAWYRMPDNNAVILLLHGAGGSRASLLPYAEMLVQHGYGVLMLDLRGHGESQGKTNRLGWQGTLDVGAAVAFLRSRSEVQHIGGLGSSMGGEVLLGAASTYPDLQAIVADGATRRCMAEYLALEANRPLVHSFTARMMYATVQFLSGEPPPLPLLESMREAGSTRFLLIAAGNTGLETSFNRLFATTLGSRAALWVVSDADHTEAFSMQPDIYEQHVLDFFQSTFFE